VIRHKGRFDARRGDRVHEATGVPTESEISRTMVAEMNMNSSDGEKQVFRHREEVSVMPAIWNSYSKSTQHASLAESHYRRLGAGNPTVNRQPHNFYVWQSARISAMLSRSSSEKLGRLALLSATARITSPNSVEARRAKSS
jgi:hypothetical protein